MSEFHSSSDVSDAPSELHYVVVDQSYDADQAAKDRANERLTGELNQGGRLRRIANSIWKGGALKEFYELKYRREARAEIEQSENVLHFQTTPETADRARLATIDRFLSDNDDMIHSEAGESREQLDDQNELVQEMKDLIRRNVEGDLSDEALIEERTRLVNVYHESHDDGTSKRARVHIDNMLEISAAVRGAIDHGESLDTVLANMKISLGESRSGVRTEARYNRVEQLADKLAQTKVGSLVGPETVLTAATVAASLARYGSHSVIGAVTKSIAPGIAGGLWAGLRENKRMKDDRAQHARERAQGRALEEGSKRREEIEETRYNSATALELTDELNRHFNEEAGFEDNDALDAALTALASVEMRIKLSDGRNIDLVTYSEAGLVEEERLALDIARAQAKTIARARLGDGEVRRRLGMDDDATLEAMLQERSDMFMLAVENDITDKDHAFNKLKRRQVAKAAAKGALFGVVLGTLAQEGIASFSDTRQGLIEQLWGASDHPINGEVHQTVLESLVQGAHHNVIHHGPDLHYDTHGLGAHGTIALSHDMSLEKGADGVLAIKNHNGDIIADHLTTNAKGELTPEALAKLHHAGITVENTSHNVSLPPTVESKTVDLHHYIDAHHADTTKVTRDFWYDNNTPQFDKNELRLEWGDHGNGVVTGHSFQFNVADMKADGSYHDGHSVAWQQAAESGKLKLAVSASAGTQTEVFMVNVKPDGTIDIPKGSPAAAFFSEHNGHAVFNGKYAEVVEVANKDVNGTTHIHPLATLVGTNEAGNGSYTVEHSVPHTEFHPTYKLTSNGYDTEQAAYTEMAPTIPIVPRQPLETLRARRSREDGGYYYNRYGELIEGGEEIPESEMSPRLWQNPDAELNPLEELKWYKQTVQKKRGEAYARDIDQLVDSSQELRELPSELKAIVKIPVNAAGEVESRDIYNVLTKAYGGQDEETLKQSLILLHVNWFDDAMNDPEKRATIEKTRSEIERAKADNPNLSIAVIETEWKRSEIQGGIIGHVSRRLNDVALFAIEKGMEDGRIGNDQDVLLIRNDADPKGMSKNYLKRYIDSASKNTATDVFTGTTSFDNTNASRLPGFVFAGNFMQSLDLLAATREGHVHTGGANFGIRASMFAAVGCSGFDDEETGAGSDDVRIGRRIQFARTRRGGTYGSGGVVDYFKSFRQRKSRASGGGAYAGSSVASPNAPSGRRRVAVRVAGARIDTDADREEALYQQGRPIIHTWDGGAFDVGGYADRSNGVNPSFARENVLKEPDVILERIRNDMQGSINVHQSEARIRTALAFVFSGMKDHPSTDGYRLTRRGDGYHFEFTELGKKEVIKRLTRDSKGRFDSYGSRKLRQMYGQAQEAAKRQATHESMIRV